MRRPASHRPAARLALDTDDGKEATSGSTTCPAVALLAVTFGGSNRFPIWSATASEWCSSRIERATWPLWQRVDGTATAQRLTNLTRDRARPGIVVGEGPPILVQCDGEPGVSLWTFSIWKRWRHRSATYGRRPRSIPSSRRTDDGWPTRCAPRSGPRLCRAVIPPRAPRSDHDGNGHHPVWLRDGERLSYRVGATDQSWSASTPADLLDRQYHARGRGGTTHLVS